MDINALLIAMGSMGGLGAIFSLGLAIADKKLYVEEDPRIPQIVDVLPGANCGACGYPGCNNFAEKVVEKSAGIGDCPVNTADAVEEMASIMGVEASSVEKKIARVLCQGGDYETAKKGEYLGISSCVGAHLTNGGDKLCEFGCIGFGDCIFSCPFDALKLNDNNVIEVIDDKCTGCGNCVDACPRSVIEIHPASLNMFVLCKSLDEAKYSRTVCTAACGGCGACAKGAGVGHITMKNNLPQIDHAFGVVEELPTKKCPTKALVMIKSDVPCNE